jgi:hypothetical protein
MLLQEAVALQIPDAVPLVNLVDLLPVTKPIEMKFLIKIQTQLETTFLGLEEERVADAADGGASPWLIGDC